MIDKVTLEASLEKEFKDKSIKTIKENLYNLYEAQSYDIAKLNALNTDKVRIKKIHAAMNQIAINTAKMKNALNKEKPDIQREIDRGNFIKGKFTNEINKLYEDIHARSKKIKAQIEFLSFVEEYTFIEPENLPYADMDGTRYAMTNNSFDENEYGQKVLFVEPKSK